MRYQEKKRYAKRLRGALGGTDVLSEASSAIYNKAPETVFNKDEGRMVSYVKRDLTKVVLGSVLVAVLFFAVAIGLKRTSFFDKISQTLTQKAGLTK